jgi:sigma-B regulation protein RsbU (phosphoserine phosphatase)
MMSRALHVPGAERDLCGHTVAQRSAVIELPGGVPLPPLHHALSLEATCTTTPATRPVALLVADVAGHGASAAMLTGVVKSAFRAFQAGGYEPSLIAQHVWTDVAAFSPDRFVTLVAAVIAPRDGQLTYVNAGHPAGLLWSANRHATRLLSTGPLVSAALRGLRWDQRTISIAEGDHLLLYTDGVSDALAGDHGIGEDRICEVVHQHAYGGASLLDAILADVARHQVHHVHRDDLTLLTARINSF